MSLSPFSGLLLLEPVRHDPVRYEPLDRRYLKRLSDLPQLAIGLLRDGLHELAGLHFSFLDLKAR